MLSDFLYTKVFLYELQSFIALFIGEEKNSLYGFLHPPMSVPPPPPQPPYLLSVAYSDSFAH